MTATPAITLRYFNCRGRAQAFRFYLQARKHTFVDARVSISEGFAAWQQIKTQLQLSGPFTRLPILLWGDQQIAETVVIHDWLHHKLGDAAKLTEQENLQHAMLSSSLRSELMTPSAMLLWQELMHPGTDVKNSAAPALKRSVDHLALLEASLLSWHWFDKMKTRPLMLADCLLWEMLDWIDGIFGEAVLWSLLPSLREFHQHNEHAALFRRMLAEHACHYTACPQEADVLGRIALALTPK